MTEVGERRRAYNEAGCAAFDIRRSCELRKPPLRKGGRASEAGEGGIHSRTQAELGAESLRRRSPSQRGLAKNGAAAMSESPSTVPEGAGDGRSCELRKPPLRKGEKSQRSWRRGDSFPHSGGIDGRIPPPPDGGPPPFSKGGWRGTGPRRWAKAPPTPRVEAVEQRGR